MSTAEHRATQLSSVGRHFCRGSLDDDELGAQGADFFQRFENGDEIAGRCADIVDCLDDVIERNAGIEQKHAVSLLFDIDVLAWNHPRFARRTAVAAG